MKKIILGMFILASVSPAFASSLSTFCSSVDGGVILGYDSSTNDYTKVIGAINSKYDDYSIANDYGYGSKYEDNSIWNNYGDYGSEYSDYSAMNSYASNPPLLITNDGTQSIYVRVGNASNSVSPYVVLRCAEMSYSSDLPNWASYYK